MWPLRDAAQPVRPRPRVRRPLAQDSPRGCSETRIAQRGPSPHSAVDGHVAPGSDAAAGRIGDRDTALDPSTPLSARESSVSARSSSSSNSCASGSSSSIADSNSPSAATSCLIARSGLDARCPEVIKRLSVTRSEMCSSPGQCKRPECQRVRRASSIGHRGSQYFGLEELSSPEGQLGCRQPNYWRIEAM